MSTDWQALLFSGGLVVAVLWIILLVIITLGWILLPFILYFRLRAIEREIYELRMTVLWKVDTQQVVARRTDEP